MAGMDLLLDSLLRLGGVDINDAKKQMHDFARKFVEQDTLLREVHAQNKAIIQHFGIAVEGGQSNGEIVAEHVRNANGSGGRI